MNKLRRLFTRARPESQELNILRGILASIEQKNKRSSNVSARPALLAGEGGMRAHRALSKTARKVKYLTKTVK
jgi:tRNA C32,U32 (ribose-2'-O)-methylase TrmJ